MEEKPAHTQERSRGLNDSYAFTGGAKEAGEVAQEKSEGLTGNVISSNSGVGRMIWQVPQNYAFSHSPSKDARRGCSETAFSLECRATYRIVSCLFYCNREVNYFSKE